MSLLRCANSRRRGLTLLELIIALGILAVMSTIAVRSLDPLASQARYESTQRLLEELRVATLGSLSARQISGQRVISGFISDTGALPSSLDDLITQPAALVSHSLQSFDSDRDGVEDVTLSSGWRGPYVQLGPGQSSLLDGWGNAPLLNPDGGDFDFTSLGSDNDSIAPEDSYRADLSVIIPSKDFGSNVVFRLFEIDATTGSRVDPSPTGTEQLGVLVYGVNANGGVTGAIEEAMLPIASTGTFEASRLNFIHGMAAARGVLWSDTDADQQFDLTETISLSSYVHYFTVTGQADVRIEMDLQ